MWFILFSLFNDSIAMVSGRIYLFDNAKYFLIFIVIQGHALAGKPLASV